MKERTKKRSRWILLLAMVLALTFSSFASAAEIKVKLNKSKATLYTTGTKTVQLKATVTGTNKKVKWSSNKKSVAAVSKNGKVTAKKAGTATITAQVGKTKKSCKITVLKSRIALNKSKVTLYTTGTKTIQLKPTVTGKSQKVKWSSTNQSVATVSAGGKVTAKKAGTATIKATANGVTATCTITVKSKKRTVEKVELRYNMKSNRYVSYTIFGKTKSGKNVWSFSTGKTHIAAQVCDMGYAANKDYVYVLEYPYFYKLDKETGKIVKQTKVSVISSSNLYIDTDGTLYAVPFLDRDVVYVISKDGVLLKTIPFDSKGNGGASIKGKKGNYLQIYLEFGDATIYVPVA